MSNPFDMSPELSVAEKCEAIVKRIAGIANKEGEISFSRDWGGNTLTINIPSRGHTHVGIPGGEFEILVSNLYNTLHDGPGLSWANVKPQIGEIDESRART